MVFHLEKLVQLHLAMKIKLIHLLKLITKKNIISKVLQAILRTVKLLKLLMNALTLKD